MKILVTGASGFVGSHLFENEAEWQRRFSAQLVRASENLDLRSEASVRASIGEHGFDAVLHLAAQSNVPASFADPASTYDINATGTVRLLHALDGVGFTGRLLLVSSGDVYGTVAAKDLPVDESVTPRPANPYAASKIAAEAAALSWGRRGKFEVVVARPFNHLGARQSTAFAIPRFASLLKAIERGETPAEIKTGRLDVTRDFLDVRDVLAAYLELLTRGRAGEIYNICSGTERSLADVLARLVALSGLTVETTIDPSLLRPIELARMVGSAAKLRHDTGWQPEIPFERTLSDLLHSLDTQ
jgi:GDP-4-dehydro-6-deoxy-D-mannose reductase